MHHNLLKLIYNGLLVTMPPFIANPINKNRIIAPIQLQPYSTYINYRLTPIQAQKISNYISDYTDKLQLVPISISQYQIPGYYLSINIYNCTSPLLMENTNIIRCELNTYVKSTDGNYGTLILDYMSSGISMDPINIFKDKNINIKFENRERENKIYCKSNRDNIHLDIEYKFTNREFHISDKLITYTDLAYYKNAIADRVYYDSTLVDAKTNYGRLNKYYFKYKNMEFKKPESVFYFKNSIRFIGSVWDNLD